MSRRSAAVAVSTVVVSTLLTLLVACGGEEGQDAADLEWPGWRGQDGAGVSAATGLPVSWDESSPLVRWRTEIAGKGNSSPAVGGGLVFVTSAIKGTDADGTVEVDRRVIAVDLATGEPAWNVSLGTAFAGRKHYINTRAAPTPVVDGERVYAYFGADLAAIDFDGEVVWHHEIDPTYVQYTRYGVASSPMVVDDLVVVFQDREYPDNEDLGWLAAFDRETGEERWRTEWVDTCCAYTTPTIVRTESGPRLLVAMSARLVEYDLATGEALWSVPHKQYQLVSGLAFEGDIACSVGGADHDKGFLCVRLGAHGEEPEVLWQRERGGAPEVSSSVLYRGVLYATTEGGRMQAFDPATGRRLWRARLPSGQYHASLVGADGKIYALSTDGGVAVIAAGESYQLLGHNYLLAGGGASPAVAGGCLLLRGENELACIAGPPPDDAAIAG